MFVLENGIKGWVDQGYKLFDGINVPSKAFGEMVELKNKTPYIKPATLAQKIKSKENIIILDGRPFDEFKKMNIPNGICCPNMEMPVRIEKKIWLEFVCCLRQLSQLSQGPGNNLLQLTMVLMLHLT